ncbi:MAG: pyrroline-5-carboxylate reductase [Micrococcus sp.]|nr:pyrroline-5-carboxylate reductase [Micrococcus sp.]
MTTTTATSPRIALLGLGKMNGAILAGMLASGIDAEQVTATTRSAASAQQAAQKYGVQVFSGQEHDDANHRAVAEADVVLVGVKPKDMADTLKQLAPSLRPEAVVVSVAAGVSAATLAACLPQGQPIVRTMPNTPLTVGSGVVGVAPGEHVSEEQARVIEELFAGSGLVVRVPEDQLSAVVAAAGSAPAYVFLLAEAIAAHAQRLGLDADDAEAMVAATVKGAGLMLQAGEETAEQLRKNVMSPGGTTAKAIETFQAGGFEQLVADAMDAAAARDAEMAEEFRA